MCSDCDAKVREAMALKAMALREEERRAKKEDLAEAFRKRNDERLAKQELASKESAEESAEGRASSDNNDDSGKVSKESVVDSLLQFQTMCLEDPKEFLDSKQCARALDEMPLDPWLSGEWLRFFETFSRTSGFIKIPMRFPRAGDVLVRLNSRCEVTGLVKVDRVALGRVFLPSGAIVPSKRSRSLLEFSESTSNSPLWSPLTRDFAAKLLKGTMECPCATTQDHSRILPCLCYLVGRDEHSDDPWETLKKECTVEDIEKAIWKKWPKAEKIPVTWPLTWCGAFDPKEYTLDKFMGVIGGLDVARFHVRKHRNSNFEFFYSMRKDTHFKEASEKAKDILESHLSLDFGAKHKAVPRGSDDNSWGFLWFDPFESFGEVVQELKRQGICPKFFDFRLRSYSSIVLYYLRDKPLYVALPVEITVARMNQEMQALFPKAKKLSSMSWHLKWIGSVSTRGGEWGESNINWAVKGLIAKHPVEEFFVHLTAHESYEIYANCGEKTLEKARTEVLSLIKEGMRREFGAEYSVRPPGNQTWHGVVLCFQNPSDLVDIIQRLNIRPKFYDFYLVDFETVDFRYTLGDPKFPPYSPVNQPRPQ